MSTNLIRKSQGENTWRGYKCFRVQCDHNGVPFPGGAKFVVFDEGRFIGAYSDQSKADLAFLSGEPRSSEIRLIDYKGIDARLRGG
jgi:hypothetical protein